MSARDVAEVGRKVRGFYESNPFPGYEEFEGPADLLRKATEGIYGRLLDEQLPPGVRILDAGCGTGQLAAFMSMTNRIVVGIDFSLGALRKGLDFKKRFRLQNVHFAQMDLFALGLREESFDYVFCNGVLHHTADAEHGFQTLCQAVRRGGYLVIGLYNKYGRLVHQVRKLLLKMTRGKLKFLDHRLRDSALGADKKHIWYLDQYENPHEAGFAIRDVLGWFFRNQIEYINSIPKISLAERFSRDEKLFERRQAGSGLEHLLSQLGWIFTQAREGGFFIVIGRRLA